jgi:hypothetical protein
MSVAQLASGILGAVCYSQERAVYSDTIFEEVGGELVGKAACHFGFIWVRTTFSLVICYLYDDEDLGPHQRCLRHNHHCLHGDLRQWKLYLCCILSQPEILSSSSGIVEEQWGTRRVRISWGRYKLSLRQEWQQVKSVILMLWIFWLKSTQPF